MDISIWEIRQVYYHAICKSLKKKARAVLITYAENLANAYQVHIFIHFWVIDTNI